MLTTAPKKQIKLWDFSSGILKSVIFFTFLGLVPVPVELGKIAAFFLKLEKIINHNSEEKNGIDRLF